MGMCALQRCQETYTKNTIEQRAGGRVRGRNGERVDLYFARVWKPRSSRLDVDRDDVV